MLHKPCACDWLILLLLVVRQIRKKNYELISKPKMAWLFSSLRTWPNCFFSFFFFCLINIRLVCSGAKLRGKKEVKVKIIETSPFLFYSVLFLSKFLCTLIITLTRLLDVITWWAHSWALELLKKKTPGDSELSWDSVIGFFILFYFCEMKIKVFNMRLVSKIVILSCEWQWYMHPPILELAIIKF